MPPFPRLARLTLAAVTLLSVSPLPAAAQTPTPSPSPTPGPAAEIALLGQPVWYGPDDSLDIKLRINNNGPVELDGFQIVVGVSPRLRTRSALAQTFESQPTIFESSLPFVFEEAIPAFGSTTITLGEPVTSFPTLATSSEGGVFPATVTLTGTTGVPIGSLSTPLIYYPTIPETAVNLSLLLPLNTVPELLPDGSFRDTSEGATLADDLAPEGWLDAYLSALETATAEPEAPPRPRRGRRAPPAPEGPPPLRLMLAPTPRFVEEVAALADGYRVDDRTVARGDEIPRAASSVLGRLRRLASAPEIQTIAVPYAFPDLPTLVAADLALEHVAEQLETGRNVIEEVLDVDLDERWIFPPAGRLDSPSLAELQLLTGAEHLLLGPRAVETTDPVIGCPSASPTFACAAEVRTFERASTALVADEGLTRVLGELPERTDDRLIVQRFFAETSMIREELPGVEGRVVQATIPSLWHPTPRVAMTLFRGIRDAPWIRSVTGDEAISASPEVAPRQIVASAPPIGGSPPRTFFDQVETTRDAVESYSDVVAGESPRVIRLKRNVLVAQSRSWWRGPYDPTDYLEVSSDEVDEELDKITITGPQAFTFTDREGELQFTITNQTGYPVRAVLSLSSPNLTLTGSGDVAVYEPGNELIRVQATARTSGQFPIRVRLTTPDGTAITESIITIRSTSLNVIALAITIGALTFLVLFYVGRALRRRKQSAEPGVA